MSEHGCEVIPPIENNQAYVKCPDENYLPKGVVKGWTGIYDTVLDPTPKMACKTKFFADGRMTDSYAVCNNPKATNKVMLISTMLVLLSKFAVDARTNTLEKLSQPDARKVAAKIVKEIFKDIKAMVKSGDISQEQAEFIAQNYKEDLDRLENGDYSVEKYYKKQFERYVKLVRRLQKENPGLPATNIDLLEFALQHFPTEELFEIVSGAHIVIQDKGKAHKKFAGMEKAFQRISSHYPKVKQPQYGKTESMFGSTYHLLSGVDEDGNSWFQFENAPWDVAATLTPKGFADNYQHGLDFIAYAYGGRKRNVGPEGSSKYTELHNRLMYNPYAKQLLGPSFSRLALPMPSQQSFYTPAIIPEPMPYNATIEGNLQLAQLLAHKFTQRK